MFLKLAGKSLRTVPDAFAAPLECPACVSECVCVFLCESVCQYRWPTLKFNRSDWSFPLCGQFHTSASFLYLAGFCCSWLFVQADVVVCRLPSTGGDKKLFWARCALMPTGGNKFVA